MGFRNMQEKLENINVDLRKIAYCKTFFVQIKDLLTEIFF